jgi:hypothetical protein
VNTQAVCVAVKIQFSVFERAKTEKPIKLGFCFSCFVNVCNQFLIVNVYISTWCVCETVTLPIVFVHVPVSSAYHQFATTLGFICKSMYILNGAFSQKYILELNYMFWNFIPLL